MAQSINNEKPSQPMQPQIKKIVKYSNISMNLGPRFMIDTITTVEESRENRKNIEEDEEKLKLPKGAKLLTPTKVIRKRRVITQIKEVRKARTRNRNFPRIILCDKIIDEETGRTYTIENFITLLGTNVEEFQLDDTEQTIYDKRLVPNEIHRTKREFVLDEEEPSNISDIEYSKQKDQDGNQNIVVSDKFVQSSQSNKSFENGEEVNIKDQISDPDPVSRSNKNNMQTIETADKTIPNKVLINPVPFGS